MRMRVSNYELESTGGAHVKTSAVVYTVLVMAQINNFFLSHTNYCSVPLVSCLSQAMTDVTAKARTQPTILP